MPNVQWKTVLGKGLTWKSLGVRQMGKNVATSMQMVILFLGVLRRAIVKLMCVSAIQLTPVKS